MSAKDPSKVILESAQHHLKTHENEKPLAVSMDLRKSLAEQDMALISFYKQTNVEWARPLKFHLEGRSYECNCFPKCNTSIYKFVTGDTAIGPGVTRFFFSTCMEKIKTGFHIHFGMYSVPLAQCRHLSLCSLQDKHPKF